MSTVAERLKTALSVKGIKQSQLADKTGIDRGSVSSYLTGRYEPKQEKLFAMARALGVSPLWLAGHDVPMHEEVEVTLANEQLKEYVVFHRNGKGFKVRFNEQQQKLFDSLVEMAEIEETDD